MTAGQLPEQFIGAPLRSPDSDVNKRFGAKGLNRFVAFHEYGMGTKCSNHIIVDQRTGSC